MRLNVGNKLFDRRGNILFGDDAEFERKAEAELRVAVENDVFCVIEGIEDDLFLISDKFIKLSRVTAERFKHVFRNYEVVEIVERRAGVGIAARPTLRPRHPVAVARFRKDRSLCFEEFDIPRQHGRVSFKHAPVAVEEVVIPKNDGKARRPVDRVELIVPRRDMRHCSRFRVCAKRGVLEEFAVIGAHIEVIKANKIGDVRVAHPAKTFASLGRVHREALQCRSLRA